ncbi:chemerin-like receptor 1 [Leptodactylus fuscus]|uniref:chemerin-like receptor 1 n=1 Tax=Leptodactylus fuscus TaxID=238119 RepID=UPI003F4EA37A
MKDNTRAYPTSGITLLDNTSSYTTEYYDDYDYYDFSSLNYFTLVVYSLIFLLGTTGNGLVIWFTIFKMKKTVNVIWFLNLSIADFTFSSFLLFNIIYLANGFTWFFGTFMCKMNTMMIFMNLSASVFFLTIISIDRCLSVIFPVWCRNHRTPRLASFIVMGIWILSITCSLPYFMLRDTVEFDGTMLCYNNFELGEPEDGGRSLHKALVIIRFFLTFVIPFTIIVTFALRIHRNRMTTSSKPYKVIMAVIVCFFICWAPYHIFSFMELCTVYQEDDLYYESRIGIIISTIMAFMNSCVNPFLYVFIGRDFKDNLWRSIQSIFEKAFNEDP